MVSVKFKHVLGGLKIPKFDKDGFITLYAVEDIIVKASSAEKVRTGLIFEVPTGYALIVVPPVSTSEKTPIRYANGIQYITSEDKEEVNVILENVTPLPKINMKVPGFYYMNGEYSGNNYTHGYLPVGSVLVQKGDVIGRAYLTKVESATLSRVEKKTQVKNNEDEQE